MVLFVFRHSPAVWIQLDNLDQIVASLGVTDGDVEDDTSFDGGETEMLARDFRTVTIQDILQTTTVSISPDHRTHNIPRTQGVPVVSSPRGLCCGIPRQRRRPVPQPVA